MMNELTFRAERRPPISASIICLNEEKNIGRCLDSLGWCDQIVVVDSGSIDRTLDIVREYQRTRILYRSFDTYINQKNYALDNCEHEWVLSIDADEVLPQAMIDEIKGLAFNVDGYHFGRRTFLGSQEIKHGTWSPDYKVRLFRGPRGRWGGTNPHERIIVDGSTARLRNRMLHYSYANREEFLQRNKKYTLMMVDYLEQSGRRTFLGQPYLHWIGNFAKSYLLRRGMLDGRAGLFLAYHIASASFMKCYLLDRRKKEQDTHKNTIGSQLRLAEHQRVDDDHPTATPRIIASERKRSA
jgi:glycosyltransferase involved in cell wall biosynthesis